MVAKGFFVGVRAVYQRPSKVVQIRSPVSHALSSYMPNLFFICFYYCPLNMTYCSQSSELQRLGVYFS